MKRQLLRKPPVFGKPVGFKVKKENQHRFSFPSCTSVGSTKICSLGNILKSLDKYATATAIKKKFGKLPEKVGKLTVEGW